MPETVIPLAARFRSGASGASCAQLAPDDAAQASSAPAAAALHLITRAITRLIGGNADERPVSPCVETFSCPRMRISKSRLPQFWARRYASTTGKRDRRKHSPRSSPLLFVAVDRAEAAKPRQRRAEPVL